MSDDAKTRISAESADAIFEDFLKYYEIDLNEIQGNQRRATESAISKIKKSIMDGQIEIMDDHFTIVVHLRNAQRLEIRELDGKAKVEMGKRENEDLHGRLYAMMGSLSGLGFNAIQSLRGPDLTRVESLGIVFLLV